MEYKRKSASFFWPIVLIGVGVILLLRNLEIIPAFNLSMLLRLWPLILVVIGLDILFGHRASWVGGVIGLVAIGGIIAFLMLSPSLGIKETGGTKTDTISEPIGAATSARYYFEFSSDPVEVNTLADNYHLISGTITHSGTLNFDVNGTTDKVVHLSQITTSNDWLQWNFVFTEQKWDIALNPNVPSELIVDGGSGTVNLDLSGMKLTSLQAAMGSGSSNFDLPVSDMPYSAIIESGSGSVEITLPAETDLELTLDSGSGSVNISVPSTSGLRIEVMDSGSGSLNIPGGMEQIGGGADMETGTWQTAGFDTAANKITIKIFNRGSGSINIH